MRRLLIILAMLLVVSGVVGAVPYPYDSFVAPEGVSPDVILRSLDRKFTASGNVEESNWFPWQKGSEARFETKSRRCCGGYATLKV